MIDSPLNISMHRLAPPLKASFGVIGMTQTWVAAAFFRRAFSDEARLGNVTRSAELAAHGEAVELVECSRECAEYVQAEGTDRLVFFVGSIIQATEGVRARIEAEDRAAQAWANLRAFRALMRRARAGMNTGGASDAFSRRLYEKARGDAVATIASLRSGGAND